MGESLAIGASAGAAIVKPLYHTFTDCQAYRFSSRSGHGLPVGAW